MSPKFLATCAAIGGVIGCFVLARMGVPEIGLVPPGVVAVLGIGYLVVTAGEPHE